MCFYCVSIVFLKEMLMKKFLSLLAVVFTLGLTTVALEADAAKRMGSGKSMGTQRQANVDKTPAAPAQASSASPGAGAAAAAPAKSWMGPVAGLAAGLGLAALASHLGFGEELASMLMFGLLAVAVMAAIGFFMRKRAAASRQETMQSTGRMSYATVSGNTPAHSNVNYKIAIPSASGLSGNANPSTGGSMIGSSLGFNQNDAKSISAKLPANFDSVAFERNAKVNFIRLQAAYDAENLDDIRQFTSPEMYAEVKMDMAERGTGIQKHEVLNIDASVLEVEEANDHYVVSVRFTGTMRDTVTFADEAFDEIWHLTKPNQGDSGWVLAGIQQVT
jgi:predicted lipid-binding transport protein (Tim44 family)